MLSEELQVQRSFEALARCAVAFVSGLVFYASAAAAPDDQASLTVPAPAVPLVTCDPYFSVWSTGSRLTQAQTTHWTAKPHPLVGMISIDGKAFRILGAEPSTVPALDQIRYKITPTQSIFEFAGNGIKLRLTFSRPALPSDIDVLSRPITYVTFDARSTDSKVHDLKI